jgi:putative flippase GtrA
LTYNVWDVGPAWVCNVIATVVAAIPAYYLNRTWTWGKKGRSNIMAEVVPFWTIALVALLLSTLAVWGAGHWADDFRKGSLDRAVIINGANLATYAVLWTARYFLLNRFLFGTASTGSVATTVPGPVGPGPVGPEPVGPEPAVVGRDTGALAPGAAGEEPEPVTPLPPSDNVDPAV